MSRNSRLRRLIWAALAAAVVVALVLAFVLGRRPTAVEVEKARRGTFEQVVEEDGRARVRDRFVVASPVAGTIERPVLHAGDSVATGDVLAVVHPVPGPLLDARTRRELEERRGAAEAGVARAKVSIERADAALSHAEGELSRARSLATSGSIPPRDVEHAELDARLARTERDETRFAAHVAEHELEMARAALAAVQTGRGDRERFEVKAPVDGIVLHVAQESEGAIPLGAPILELGDPSAIEVVVDLLSTDAVRVDRGAEASLLGWGGEGTGKGRVRLVEPTARVKLSALGVEEQRVDVIVDPIGAPEAFRRVGDGYRVDVRIVVARIERALLVPTSALFREHGDWCAFVVEAGRASKRVVHLRTYGTRDAVVEDGIADGALVVARPSESLRDGERVEPRTSDAPGAPLRFACSANGSPRRAPIAPRRHVPTRARGLHARGRRMGTREPTRASVLASLAIAAFLGSCGRQRPTPQDQQPIAADRGRRVVRLDPESLARLGVSVESIGGASTALSLEVPGTLGYDLERYAEIGTPLEGRVTSLAARVGDEVKKGRVVATVLVPAVATAQADYLSARAAAIAAKKELDREESMLPARATTEREVVAARSESARADAQLAAAEARLRALRVAPPASNSTVSAAGSLSLASPIDGVVVERRANLGQFLEPSDTAFVVADLSDLWATLDVHEADVPYLHVGAEVELRVESAGDRVVRGPIALVEPTLGRATRTVHARVAVPNRDGTLRPGSFVRASIRLPDDTPGRVLVPAHAVQPVADDDVVFVEREPGVFELRPIAIRRRSADLVEVESGVSNGERVAVKGAFLLRGEALKR